MIIANHSNKFSVRQQKSIIALARGQNYSEVCRNQNIARQTLWRWRQDPEFIKAIELQKAIFFKNMVSEMAEIQIKANDVLQEKLDSGDREAVKLAFLVLSSVLLGKSYRKQEKTIAEMFS